MRMSVRRRDSRVVLFPLVNLALRLDVLLHLTSRSEGLLSLLYPGSLLVLNLVHLGLETLVFVLSTLLVLPLVFLRYDGLF